MSQVIDVENYGKVTFTFAESLEHDLAIVDLALERKYNDILYKIYKVQDSDLILEDMKIFKQYLKDIHTDCNLLTSGHHLLDDYGLKKNGKFRKGSVSYYNKGRTFCLFDSEFTSSWYTVVVYGKAVSENEIVIHCDFKWLTY